MCLLKCPAWPNDFSHSEQVYQQVLSDKWRKKHPNEQIYTWFSLKYNENVASRLDRIYTSDEINYHKTTLDTPIHYNTDHTPVTVTFSLKQTSERGPGFWKFNNTLLDDPEYIEYMEKVLQWDKNKTDLPKWWERQLFIIKQKTIEFSTKNVRD